jgi:thiol-disulfide isomerase/thioredoxin
MASIGYMNLYRSRYPIKPVATIPVKLYNRDTFNLFIKDNKNKISVIDIYSSTCIPCKKSKPIFYGWAKKYTKAAFAEIEFNSNTRDFLKDIGINQLPTFQVYHDENKLLQIVGNNQLRIIENILLES